MEIDRKEKLGLGDRIKNINIKKSSASNLYERQVIQHDILHTYSSNLPEVVESSSSFESLINYRYDVFLSFRGADTGNSFTNHLYEALVDANLETFFEDEAEIETEQEDFLKPELESAIRASRASIVVLSKNYASSTRCLNELLLILEQHKIFDHIVIPIYYHVDPADVRKQQRSFGDAMAEHRQKMETEANVVKRIQSARHIYLWNKALSEVAHLKGEIADDRLETMLIEDIVKCIHKKVGVDLRRTMGDLIGVDYPIRFISSWLNDGCTYMADVLSICGISGIGKTSLAKYVFDRYRSAFHKSSFIEDISKRCTEHFNGLIHLQHQLHGDISEPGSIQKAHDLSIYTSKIGNALAGKKVLLVLDEVDNLYQLNALLGTKALHPGSKIIITTKDASLTERYPLVKPYKSSKVFLKGLNMVSSLHLLRFHAFQGVDLKDGYKQLSEKLSKFCKGHPLALKVLGRSLCDRDVAEWEEYIEELENDPDSHIKNVLRMSFESLPSQNDKEMFKYIACFFVGIDRDYTETILKACGFRIVLGTKNLLDRGLLTIGPSNEFMMHQLLQDMGRDLVLQESFDKPWKRSRLWHHKESFKVLKEKKGKGKLLGLALDMRMFGSERLNGSYVLNTDALSKMYNLMLLQLNYVQMDGSYENFPEELRWLCMHGFPLKSIPSNIPMENLTALDMSYSDIESFGICVSNQPSCEGEQKKVIGSLKILDLSFCEHLHRLGGFLELPALERLIVRNCTSLIEICESLVKCVELVHIDLRYCTKLENLPPAIDKLEKVKTLLLDGCNAYEAQKLIQRNQALTEDADVKRQYIKGRETEFIEGIGEDLIRSFAPTDNKGINERLMTSNEAENVEFSWMITSRIDRIVSPSCSERTGDVGDFADGSEFDLICRQLGLGPPDFSIPVADYEAHRVLYGGPNDETEKAHAIKFKRPPRLTPPPALSLRGMIGDDLSSNKVVMTSNEVANVEISGMITSTIDRIGSFKNWQKGEFLGRGSFGTVYEGYTEFGFFFAVKEVTLLDQGSQGKQSIIRLEQEISLLSQFDHENIVRYLGTDTADGKLYIFLELVTKGSLAMLYQKYTLGDSQVSAYTRQILSGLNYLHERKIVHSDIKCANILVAANGSVKLADFGLAKSKARTLYGITSKEVTPYWMAPEVVNNRANKVFGLAADIWSLGCTVLEMLTRKIPYYHLEGMQALFKIGRGELPEIPNTLSTEAQDFILKCLQVNPNDRPTAAQLLDHPFVKGPASMK